MWLALLIIHGLLAFLLLGAITHQVVSVWAPAHARRGNILARFSAVPGAGYVNAVIVLYLVNATFGGLDLHALPHLGAAHARARHSSGKPSARSSSRSISSRSASRCLAGLLVRVAQRMSRRARG